MYHEKSGEEDVESAPNFSEYHVRYKIAQIPVLHNVEIILII